MKKLIVLASILAIMTSLSGCKSGPQAHEAPPVIAEKNKSVFVDMVYDPALLITYDDKQGVIEDLQSRLHAMGYGIATSQDRADIILKITITDLVLAPRNKRLLSRMSFGLVKDEAYMTYTASFVDSRTFDEIAAREGRVKLKKYFPSAEEIKAKFLSEMKDDVLTFMSESSAFK
jgi:hypothetical protein